MQVLKVKANAKINLTLTVTGKRDDGYHTIDTVMQSVSLADEITVKPADNIMVKCSQTDFDGKENIAYTAAELFFEATDIKAGAYIEIKKNIPAAAGLGGGSADAAAVLLALDRIYKTNLSYETLCHLALRLGADVPFFLKGGTQRAEGIGEKLTQINALKSGYFLLAKADAKPSTAEMYRKLDCSDYKKASAEEAIKACEKNDIKALSASLGNSFSEVWKNSSTEKILLSSEADGVSLSGSGPTWFALFEDYDKAKHAETFLKEQNITVFLVAPCQKAIIFE